MDPSGGTERVGDAALEAFCGLLAGADASPFAMGAGLSGNVETMIGSSKSRDSPPRGIEDNNSFQKVE